MYIYIHMFVDPCEVNNVYCCKTHHFFLHQGPGLKIPKHEDLVESVFERWVFHVKFSVQRTRRYGWEQIHRPKSTYSQRLAHSRNHVLLTYMLEDKSYPNFATCSGVDKTWHRDTKCSPTTKRPPHLYVSPSIHLFFSPTNPMSQILTFHQVRVRLGFQSFAMYKLLVDLSQLAFYFGLAPISMAIAAFVVRKGDGGCWTVGRWSPMLHSFNWGK